jgi:hypothetical protein
MRNMKKVVAFIAASIQLSSMASAQNIAAGAPVSLSGTFGTLRSGAVWSPGPLANASSVTDNVFLSEGSVWQTNTVWWDAFATGAASNRITIDLLGLYEVTGVTLQGDDNEQYNFEYLDSTNNWVAGGFVPVAGGGGLRTRSLTSTSWMASKIRISASGGDGYYSVSEFQAQGRAVPEPTTLLAMSIGSMLLVRKRNRK